MLQLLDLPNEVLDITFGNLRQQELYNLCLVSRKTYESAKSYLYRDVTVLDRKDFGDTGTLNGLRSFLHTIWKNPKLADQIVSLKLLDAPVRSSSTLKTEADWRVFKPYHQGFPRPDNKEDEELCDKLFGLVDNEWREQVPFLGEDVRNRDFIKNHMKSNSRCALVGLILNRLHSRLHTLRIDVDRNAAGTKMNPPINILTMDTEDYVALRNLTVRGHDFHAREGVPILHADGWAWMPALNNMTLDNLTVKDLYLKRTDGDGIDSFANLEHVALTNCTLDFHLSALFTPHLRSLAVENCRYARYSLHERKPVTEEWLCKDSLESLTILDSDCTASGSFANFSSLKYLALETPEWLGATTSITIAGAMPGTMPSMENLLPPSLVGLHLGNVFFSEFPPRPQTCKSIETQMLSLLQSRNDGSLMDLEFVEVSIYGHHGSQNFEPPRRQLKMRETLQTAYRDAGPRENSHGQLVEIFFTMLCSCVWDSKLAREQVVTAVENQGGLNACWLAQERTFRPTGVAVPAA